MKLLTQEIKGKLPKLYEQEELGEQAIAHVKFFTPWTNWTWYATEGQNEDGDFIFFGLVVGMETELGYFSLNELESVQGPFGLRIERDLHWTPRTLEEARRLHEPPRRPKT
jgi:Protein of unknown function (DUF2958)